MINCKNYDIDDMQKIIILNQDLKSLSLSHTHTHTLNDNSFSDHISKDAICGNLTSIISNYHCFLSFHQFFQTLLHLNPMFIKTFGQISINKSLYWTILKKTGVSFTMSKKMMSIIPLTIFF